MKTVIFGGLVAQAAAATLGWAAIHIGPAAWVLAQVGQDPSSTPVPGLDNVIGSFIGVSPIVGFMFWQLRNLMNDLKAEREYARAKEQRMEDKMLPALAEVSHVLAEVRAAMAHQVQEGRQPRRDDEEPEWVRRLERTIERGAGGK